MTLQIKITNNQDQKIYKPVLLIQYAETALTTTSTSSAATGGTTGATGTTATTATTAIEEQLVYIEFKVGQFWKLRSHPNIDPVQT